MIVRVIRRADGVLGFQDVNFQVSQEEYYRKDNTANYEDHFRQQYQDMFPKHEIKHVWVIGDETRYDSEEDFKEVLAKELGLLPRSYDYESPLESVLDAAASFANHGYAEADPLKKLMENKLGANGKPIICRWCGRLHWSQDHQNELENPDNAQYMVTVNEKMEVMQGNHRIEATKL